MEDLRKRAALYLSSSGQLHTPKKVSTLLQGVLTPNPRRLCIYTASTSEFGLLTGLGVSNCGIISEVPASAERINAALHSLAMVWETELRRNQPAFSDSTIAAVQAIFITAAPRCLNRIPELMKGNSGRYSGSPFIGTPTNDRASVLFYSHSEFGQLLRQV